MLPNGSFSNCRLQLLGHASIYLDSPLSDQTYVIETQEAFQKYCIYILNFHRDQFPAINFAERKVIIIRKPYQGKYVGYLGLHKQQYDVATKTFQLTTAFFGGLSCTNRQDARLVLTIPRDWSFTLEHNPEFFPSESLNPRANQLRREAEISRISDLGELDKICLDVRVRYCGLNLITTNPSNL